MLESESINQSTDQSFYGLHLLLHDSVKSLFKLVILELNNMFLY